MKSCVALLGILSAIPGLAGCSGGAGRGSAREEISVGTSDKARDILGIRLQLFEMRDRREHTGFRAWSFRLRNNEESVVSIRCVPLFIDADGKELGGSAEAQEAQLPPGADREFYFKAPTGAAQRLMMTFEFK